MLIVKFCLAEMSPVTLCLLTRNSFNRAIRALIVGPDALNVPGDGSFRTFVRNWR